MSKEMIISVNGREKKIAIIENGQVTEFYIERGVENAGVVGNIYKGRVMRVLPGMQSAFVDIGLERDAFLYVSDFFDEEEEIERIVMEKSKEKKSPDEADKEATDEIHTKRLKRDKQIDDTQEKAEIEGVADAEEVKEEQPQQEQDKSQDSESSQRKTSKRKRGRRGKIDEDKRDEDEKAEKREKRESEREHRTSKKETYERKLDKSDDSDEIAESENTKESKKSRLRPVPTFEFEDSGFERIVDEDENADVGEMLKDAMMQEAIIDKVRAIEFDMESSDSAEVGSLIDSVSDQANRFQRVADEDEEEETRTKSKRGRGEKKSGRGRKTSLNKEDSDENESTEENSEPETKEKKTTKRRRSTKSRKGTAAKKNTGGRKSKKTEDAADSESEENMEETESKQTKSARSRKTSGKRSRKSDVKNAAEKTLEDGEASVTENTEISEMAVRRGSRGGRRRTPTDSAGKDPAKTKTHKDKGYKSNDADKTITADDAIESAEFSKSSSSSGNGRRNNRRREKSQQKISDLLHEGQEILVQIAKEPIARKGARITSHIALPGRYLVYMPTIEHLGVSRKIESAKERGRLRNLLEKVIKGENIPSGGFIVRTAGTGKSEDDIRDDARYLTQTWNEIRKDAEQAKSPELIHQDLDIVQRLIRDQLSDDFTAIRVDSEEEYQRTIEFVNRIQPKMVKRVKFHTSDKPILETYGVAGEIDKALKHRVWLKSGGYLVINQTEALIAIDVNTGKFVGKGNERLEDTITKTNMEAVKEISRQIRLRDLGGIIVLDLIDMEDRRNRQKVLQELQENLSNDKSPTKVLSFNDFGLIIMTRKRVKQSLERTLCSPCNYCEGAGWIKSTQTVCYEILDEARSLSKNLSDVRHTTLRVHPEVAETLRTSESEVLEEIEDYLGVVDLTGDKTIHQEQFDFAFI
ncbi:MAG: Rne/Rng family ribonuclease [Acidobacteriota bacterium]|jgi:ribonuclease G|nr:Rne/Rng family ribonuclease [Acidobacteriota bacterium]